MPSTALEVTARFFAAIESRDIERVKAMYTEDVVVWHNFSNATQTREQNLAVLAGLCAAVASLRYEVLERVDLGARVLQRHTLCCRLADAREFRIPACILVGVRGERVCRIDEYLDTAQANALRAATGRAPVVSALP
jgi:ketosteroid isomerase-like protein